MVNDIYPLLISVVYMIIAIGITAVLDKTFSVPSVIVRKLLHVLSSIWVFMMVYGFESVVARCVGPAAFIVINGVYAKRNQDRFDNGIVTFPIALLLFALLFSFDRVSAETAVSSMLILGFGDGAAGIIGYISKTTKKSLQGSIAMLAMSLIVLFVFSSLSLPFILLVALLATLVEYLTPSGLDNLTVPLTTALAMEIICIL